MKKRHKNWARQFYTALLSRGQTWTRDSDTLWSWASDFSFLEADHGRRTVERVLAWFCKKGCGALYVPIVGTGQTFCDRFDDIQNAKRNLRKQKLTYFDDLLTYPTPRLKGSRIQREYQTVAAKVARQIRFVDDLVHKRVKLPKQKPEPAETESLTKKEREQLSRLLIVDRDIVWQLLMERPGMQMEWANYLKAKGWFKKLRRFGKRRLMDESPF